MTNKITLNSIGALDSFSTAEGTINSNSATIVTAFNNTLSRDGTSPNTMSSNIDMNSNQILNLPAPVSSNSPARLVDILSNPTLTLTIPPVGTSGATVGLLNASKTDSGSNTFSGGNSFTGVTSFVGNASFFNPVQFNATTTLPSGTTITSPTLVTPVLGTPVSGNLSNCTTVVGGISNLGTGVGTFLITPGSTNLRTALTDGTGTGSAVFSVSPQLITPSLGAATATSILATGTVGVGYATGAGGAVTQGTNRTTGVTLNKTSGGITMFTAAGSATAATFTVTNSTVAATDTVSLAQKSGTNLYNFIVTAVAAGSFNITFYTTGGTSSDAPVINFNVIKGVNS